MNNFNEKKDFKDGNKNLGSTNKKLSSFPNKSGNWKLLGVRELNRSDIKVSPTENNINSTNIKTTLFASEPIHDEKNPANPATSNVTKKPSSLDKKKQVLEQSNTTFPGLTVSDFLTTSPQMTVENLREWMKTPKAAFYSEENILFQFDDVALSLPIIVRDEICKELGWSLPTYYRHKRGGQKKELSPLQTKTIMDIICKYSSGLMHFINTLLRNTYIDLQR